MHGAKKVVNTIINIVLWVLIVIIAFFAVVTFSQRGNGKVMNLFGYTPMTVLSDSMAPTFQKDDMILVRAGDPSTYQVDDIISFWTVLSGQKVINTHRIISIYNQDGIIQFTTKGDANDIADTYQVGSADVIGKYVTVVPFLGKVMNVLGSSIGFLLIIVLPLLAFFIYQIVRLISLSIEMKKVTVMEATKAAIAEAEQERLKAEAASAPPAGAGPPAEEPTEEPADKPAEESTNEPTEEPLP